MTLPGLGTSIFLGAILSLLGLSACTSTGGDAAATLAMTSTADPALPDTVAVLPTSSTADPQALASAGAAEASVQAVAASAGTSEAPTLASAGAARAEAQPIAGTQAKPAALTVARAAPIRGAAATAPAATEVATPMPKPTDRKAIWMRSSPNMPRSMKCRWNWCGAW